MKRSLIVGVDGTGDSKNALARAAEWAGPAGLRLVVVYVRRDGRGLGVRRAQR